MRRLQQQIFRSARHLPDAAQHYRTVLQAQPNQAEANHNLGVLAIQAGQYAVGLHHLKNALDALPSEEQHWRSYAEGLLASGQAKAAQTLLQKAIQHGFKSSAVQALRQKAKVAAQQKTIKGAVTPTEQNRLVALFNAGRYEELENQAPLLIERHPDSGFLWKMLGCALGMQGKDALPALDKAAKFSPDDIEVQMNLKAVLEKSSNDYSKWIVRYDTLSDDSRTTVRARIDRFTHKPLISVLMPVYNPSLKMLEDAIRSVQNQLYPNWELCIADDASTEAGVCSLLQHYAKSDSRIKVVFRGKNGHISAASNSALNLVCGDYTALLDHDDLLSEHALFWLADAILAHPLAGLIYSDEDKIDESGQRYEPYFKPDWNPDLFLSQNMINHLAAYRTDLVKNLGGFREGYEGAQDYDLALRCIEQLAPQEIVHIPRVLYHWRSHAGSTALGGSEKSYAGLAGERALNDHFARIKVSAKAELLDSGYYRTRYNLPPSAPWVSLIIPTRNGLHLIKPCIESILAKNHL